MRVSVCASLASIAVRDALVRGAPEAEWRLSHLGRRRVSLSGRCYCGQLRYEAGGNPIFQVQCHCRECQYISGGMPVVVMGMPEPAFRFTQGTPKGFHRSDLAKP